MSGIKTTASIAVLVLLTACSTVKLQDKAAAPVEDRNTSSKSSAPTPQEPSTDAVASSNVSSDPLNDPNSILAKRSVYFDFDSYAVKDEYNSLIEAHAKYLASHPERKVVLQGNTDERGGSEYNLALGQRRADAVKKQLVLMGAPESQIESVSLGKEKPKALGDNESAWAENRRADMLYNGEY
jgi:peptidoglycan-associated lipoprotein